MQDISLSQWPFLVEETKQTGASSSYDSVQVHHPPSKSLVQVVPITPSNSLSLSLLSFPFTSRLDTKKAKTTLL